MCRLVASFTTRPIYPGGRGLLYPPDAGWKLGVLVPIWMLWRRERSCPHRTQTPNTVRIPASLNTVVHSRTNLKRIDDKTFHVTPGVAQRMKLRAELAVFPGC